MPRHWARICFFSLYVAALVPVLLAGRAAAHEIPNDVTVQVLVKAEEGRIRALVRVPLEAMQDIQFAETGPGYLDIQAAGTQLRDAATIWLSRDLFFFANGESLGNLELVAARASIPSDRSFRTFDTALAHVLGEPLPDGIGLVWQQALLDVLFEAPLADRNAALSIQTRFERLGQAVVTVIHYFLPDGNDRVFQISGNSEVEPLDPGALQAAFRFLALGFEHILDGVDHLLFLLCLVIPFRERLGSLIGVVTAFTLAHSVTLIGSAYGLAPNALWFPPLVETLIAASILYMAIENAVAPTFAMRWGITFVFGLIHGFGFSFALRNTLQFAGDHLLTSLLSFNVGVELGQILVLLLLIPVLRLVFGHVLRERVGVLLVSIIVGHVAWHWMTERFAIWRAYNVGWRDAIAELSSLSFALLFTAAMAALVLAAWRYRLVRVGSLGASFLNAGRDAASYGVEPGAATSRSRDDAR